MEKNYYTHPQKPVRINKKIIVKKRIAEFLGMSVSYVEQLLNNKKHNADALDRVWIAIDVLYGNNFESITKTLKSETVN